MKKYLSYQNIKFGTRVEPAGMRVEASRMHVEPTRMGAVDMYL
jgi:hypothetical protein